MNKEAINKEQMILEAAEQEFLEHGFARAKTTEIAKRAGVNHAMIHYYYRTKEDLFNIVFQQKILIISDSFITKFETGATFIDKVRAFTEAHYNFFKENQKIAPFVYTEIVLDEKRRNMIIEKMKPKLTSVIGKLSEQLKVEIESGRINEISPLDLILNIVATNLISFLALPIIEHSQIMDTNAFVDERLEKNIQFILNSLIK